MERAQAETHEPAPEAAAATRGGDAQDLLSGPVTPASILALQRAAGNTVVGRALARQKLQRNGKTKARAERQMLWATPSARASAEELLGELDIALRSAPENIAGTGVWVHIVVTGGRLHAYDTDLKPLGTFRLQANARLPGDGYYLSALAMTPAKGGPGQLRWLSSKLGVSPDVDDDVWMPQGYGGKNGTGKPQDIMLNDWVAASDRAAMEKAIGPLDPTRLGMVVAGYGSASSASKASKQVARIRALLAKKGKGKGAGPGEDKTKGTDPSPKAKDEAAAPKDQPDSVAVVEDKRGIHIRITVAGARQDIEYRDGESDAKLLERIENATAKVRDEIDPSKSTRIRDGATKTQIDAKPGVGGVAVPDGFPVSPGGRVPNAPGYDAVIVSHGPGGRSGQETTVIGATLNFTMELDYAGGSLGFQDEVFNRMQPVAYKWELINVDNLDLKQIKEKLKGPGSETDSGIARDLARDLANTWEDTENDLADVRRNPALAGYLQVVAISDLIQVGGALIGSFFSLISQPLDERSIGFNDKGDYILRCFAQPVVDDDTVERIRERGGTPVIRAPSAAVISVRVAPINVRAQEVNDAEQTKIDQLRAQLDDPPFPYTREDVQKQLDAAIAALGDNNIQAIDRQIKGADDELERIRTWRDADLKGVSLDARNDDLRLWKAMLSAQGVELGPYEKQMQEMRDKLVEARKRYVGFGLKGVKTSGQVFRPRMSLASEINGQVFSIVANLAEATTSKEDRRVWRLIDVTSAETQDIYEGAGPTHTDAIRAAFDRFRDDSGYGRGSLAVTLPTEQLKAATGETVTLVEPVLRVRPGSEARALKRLQDLATAMEIAGLVVAGPVGIAIGVAGGVAGGVVAVQNMRRRAAAERLKLDFQTGMDVLGVVGAVVAVGGVAARGAARIGEAGAAAAQGRQLGRAEQALQTLAKRAVWMGDALHIAGQGMMHGQWIIIPASVYFELEEIAKEEKNDPNPSAAKYRARRLEALAKGLKSGVVQVRTMQMASNPGVGWDPFRETPAGKAPIAPPPGEPTIKPLPTDVPAPAPKPATDAPAQPPKGPPHEPPAPRTPPRRPPSGADEPTIYATDKPRPIEARNFKGWMREALGRGNEPHAHSIVLVDPALIEAIWNRASPGKPMPEGSFGYYDPDFGRLYLSRPAFMQSAHLQTLAFEAILGHMNPRGRAAVPEQVARAVGELGLQASIVGTPPVDAASPAGRALQQRLATVLGPDALTRLLFGGEVNTFRSKLAEAYGSARGNAIEAALRKGDIGLSQRLAAEPDHAMSSAFGELLAVATSEMHARQAGGKPINGKRAALAEQLADLVGRDIVDAAYFGGRTEPLRAALERTLGPEGLRRLVDALRAGDVAGASSALTAKPPETHAGPAPAERPPSGPEQPAREPAPHEPGSGHPAPPQAKDAQPLGPKGAELRTALERSPDPKAAHEAALDAIVETGSFKELRGQVDAGLFGPQARATEVIQQARREVVDGVLGEIKRVLEAKYPGVEIRFSDLGTPGFTSDRDITIKAGGTADINTLIAASVEGVRAAYDVLNGNPPGAGPDPFAGARAKTGGRKLAPDRILDSNFYTELHEGSVKPGSAAERRGIIEDQSVVSLAELRANMHDAAEWTAYREKLLKAFEDPGADPAGTEAQLNRFAAHRLKQQLDAAEQLHAELHPPDKTSEQVLGEVQQQLLDALRTGAPPREVRALQARIKLLEPDAYGTRAAVVGVVDQAQGAARAENRRQAWEALSSGKEPLTPRELAATSAQEAAASAGKLRHAAPDSGATTAQCVSAAKYLARVWEGFRKAGLNMQHPLLDRTGEIIGSKQEPNAQKAAMGELRRWAEDHDRVGLDDQGVRDAFVREVKALGEQLDQRLRRNEAIQAGMDPTPAELAALKPSGGPGPQGGGPAKPPPKEPGAGGPPKAPPPKEPPSGGGPGPAPKAPKPAKEPGLEQFQNADAVRDAVVASLSTLKRSTDPAELPHHYQTCMDLLAKSKSPVNKKLLKLLPIVEAGLRNPELYGRVMADAWEIAVMHGISINAALVQMAKEGGVRTKVIPKKAGALSGNVFFDEHVTRNARIIDKGIDAEHGTYTHLLQDLVVDRALRAAGRTENGLEFRQLLARAEGVHGGKLPVGDLIWRVTYDTEDFGHINTPESAREALARFGLK